MTSGLHILVISDVSPATITGGAERVLWEQVSRLVKLGHEVRVLDDMSRGRPQRRQAAAKQRVVVDHQHADRAGVARVHAATASRCRAVPVRFSAT